MNEMKENESLLEYLERLGEMYREKREAEKNINKGEKK